MFTVGFPGQAGSVRAAARRIDSLDRLRAVLAETL